MDWRGIPILAALGVLGVARILHDPMPATAPAAAINSEIDGATDLSRVDFTPWLNPAIAPTTAPTTMPLMDHTDDGSESIDQAANTSTTGPLTYFRRFVVEKIPWGGAQSAGGVVPAPDPFAQPAIDIDASPSSSLVNFATDFSGETSFAGRSKSSQITPAAPLSDDISSANEPAFSIVGYDFPANTPLPRPTSSLPPISVPEPGTMLLAIAALAIARIRH